jgi:hypothetical protein
VASETGTCPATAAATKPLHNPARKNRLMSKLLR